MRTGTQWKNPRFRKHGGGDLYIEENQFKAAKDRFGDNLEYAAYPMPDGRSIIKFRPKKD